MKETPEPANAPMPMKQGTVPDPSSQSKNEYTVGRFAAQEGNNDDEPLRYERQSSKSSSGEESPKTMMRLEGFMAGLGNNRQQT